MANKKVRLGSHCPQILGADGLPLLQLPQGWPGLRIEETIVPARAECGPQYTGMPILSVGINANVRRWYRSGCKTIELNEPPPAFDILGSTYERDYGRWEGEKGSCLKVSLTPAVMQRYFPEEAPFFDLETRFAHTDTQLRELLLSLAHEIKTGLPNGVMYAEALSMAVIGWLSQHYRASKNSPRRTSRKLSPRHQSRIEAYVEEFLDTDITVDKLAALAGISPSHFFLLFRASFGLPPHQYMMKRRVEKAARLLKSEPDRAISDIAISTGFSSQAHLTKIFKRYMKQTPLRWRSQ